MSNNNESKQYDLFMNPNQSTHEYELEFISDSLNNIKYPLHQRHTKPNDKLGLFERALSAAGAAFVSAIIVNPLDVAKVCNLSLLFLGIVLWY